VADLGPDVCRHELGRLIFIQARDGTVDTPKPRQGFQEIGSATGLYLDLGFNTNLTQRQ